MYPFILVIFLVHLPTAIQGAAVSFVGTTDVTAMDTAINITCRYDSLAVNETVAKLEITSPKTTVFTWTEPAGSNFTITTGNWNAITGTRSVNVVLPKNYVTKNDGGAYTCTLVSSTGTHSRPLEITVSYQPEISVSQTAGVIERNILSVSCTADGHPTAQLSWKKGSQNVSQSGTLSIDGISRDKAGIYTCTASNSVGETSKNTTVTVYYFDQPQITITPDQAEESESVQINCAVDSVPRAVVSISGPIPTPILREGSQSISQTIQAVGCLQAGAYNCTAVNPEIATRKTVSKPLEVLCKPRKDNKPSQTVFYGIISEHVIIEVDLIAFPALSFNWSRIQNDTGDKLFIQEVPGHFEMTDTPVTSHLNVTIQSEEDYGLYVLKAKNSQGESTYHYYIKSRTRPFQVTSLSVANVTTDSFTVTWLSSFNGGARQDYVIQYRPIGMMGQVSWTEKLFLISDPGRKQQVYARISDIHPGRTYSVRVYSNNTFGLSEFSVVINVTTTELPTELSVGVGVAIGMVICIALALVLLAGFFLYRRLQNKGQGGSDAANRKETNYSSLDRNNMETPTPQPTYDDLNKKPNPLYENVDNKNSNGSASGTTSPDVYMNYNPNMSEEKPNSKTDQKKDKKLKAKNRNKKSVTTEEYENTEFGGSKDGSHKPTNKTEHENVYANS